VKEVGVIRCLQYKHDAQASELKRLSRKAHSLARRACIGISHFVLTRFAPGAPGQEFGGTRQPNSYESGYNGRFFQFLLLSSSLLRFARGQLLLRLALFESLE